MGRQKQKNINKINRDKRRDKKLIEMQALVEQNTYVLQTSFVLEALINTMSRMNYKA